MPKKEDLLKILLLIQADIRLIKQGIHHLQQNPAGFNPVGKYRRFGHVLRGALCDPEIRNAILVLRKRGYSFSSIRDCLKREWPEKYPSRSAIHRFVESSRNGRLREFE